MKQLILLLALSIGLFAQTVNPSLTNAEKSTYQSLVTEQRILASERETVTALKTALMYRERELERNEAAQQKAVSDFVASIAAAHPGYTLGEKGQLVKTPEKK